MNSLGAAAIALKGDPKCKFFSADSNTMASLPSCLSSTSPCLNVVKIGQTETPHYRNRLHHKTYTAGSNSSRNSSADTPSSIITPLNAIQQRVEALCSSIAESTHALCVCTKCICGMHSTLSATKTCAIDCKMRLKQCWTVVTRQRVRSRLSRWY